MYHIEQFYPSDWLDQANNKVLPIPICESEVILPREMLTIFLAIARPVLVFL
ncbi:MAG: hypothetical protein ACYTXY_25455 [Nostoc sp.]